MTKFIIGFFALFLTVHIICAGDLPSSGIVGPSDFADRNMLYNPEFTGSAPWTDGQKQSLQANKITAESPEFASSWFVASNGSPANTSAKYSKNVDVNGKKVNVIGLTGGAGEIVLGAYFYNLPISVFPAAKYFQFGITAKGNGQITFGFYCYQKDTAKFIGAATIGTFALSGNWSAVWSKPFDNSIFPPATGSVAPFISFSGDGETSSAALCEVSKEQHNQ
jgi:hypothetical protein